MKRGGLDFESILARVPQRRWVWWLGAGIAIACVAVFLRWFDLRAVSAAIAAADPRWIAGAVVANFAMLPLMTAQWRRLLPRGTPAPRRAVWDCVTISMAGMNTLPFGGGHALAVALLARRGVATVSGAVSLLALEQVCEGVSRILLLLVALAVAPLSPRLMHALVGLVLAVSAGLAVMLFFARRPAGRAAMPAWRSALAHHLEVLRRPRAFLAGVALSIAMKAVGIAAVWAAQRSLGVELPISSAVLVFTAITFGTGIALSPGNVGTFELAAIAAYRLLGVTGGDAAALGIVHHACFLAPIIGTGYGVALWRMARKVRTSREDRDKIACKQAPT